MEKVYKIRKFDLEGDIISRIEIYQYLHLNAVTDVVGGRDKQRDDEKFITLKLLPKLF